VVRRQVYVLLIQVGACLGLIPLAVFLFAQALWDSFSGWAFGPKPIKAVSHDQPLYKRASEHRNAFVRTAAAPILKYGYDIEQVWGLWFTDE